MAGDFVDFSAANFDATSAIAQSVALYFGFIEAALRESDDGSGGSFGPKRGGGAVEIAGVVEAGFAYELRVGRILRRVGRESGKFAGEGCFVQSGEIGESDGVSAPR